MTSSAQTFACCTSTDSDIGTKELASADILCKGEQIVRKFKSRRKSIYNG